MKTYEVASVYCGTNIKKRKNLDNKIGYTAQDLFSREYQICTDKKHPRPNYRMLCRLKLFNVTETQLRHIESETQVRMEKYANHHGNDYFSFKAQGKTKLCARAFCAIAMGYAIDCCLREGYQFEFEWVR